MSFGGRTKSMHGTSQRTRGDEMLAGMVLQYLPLPPGYDMTCRRVKPQAHVYYLSSPSLVSVSLLFI